MNESIAGSDYWHVQNKMLSKKIQIFRLLKIDLKTFNYCQKFLMGVYEVHKPDPCRSGPKPG